MDTQPGVKSFTMTLETYSPINETLEKVAETSSTIHMPTNASERKSGYIIRAGSTNGITGEESYIETLYMDDSFDIDTSVGRRDTESFFNFVISGKDSKLYIHEAENDPLLRTLTYDPRNLRTYGEYAYHQTSDGGVVSTIAHWPVTHEGNTTTFSLRFKVFDTGTTNITEMMDITFTISTSPIIAGATTIANCFLF